MSATDMHRVSKAGQQSKLKPQLTGIPAARWHIIIKLAFQHCRLSVLQLREHSTTSTYTSNATSLLCLSLLHQNLKAPAAAYWLAGLHACKLSCLSTFQLTSQPTDLPTHSLTRTRTRTCTRTRTRTRTHPRPHPHLGMYAMWRRERRCRCLALCMCCSTRMAGNQGGPGTQANQPDPLGRMSELFAQVTHHLCEVNAL